MTQPRPGDYDTLTDRHAVVDGVRIAYADDGAGGPVVFIHGTPSHSYLWRSVAPAVRNAGFRTIVYDLLGFGRSERPLGRDTSVVAQADLLVALLDRWKVPPATVVAHDIGGAIGQILAVRSPERVRGLMLVDTVAYDSWPSETWRRIIRENEGRRYVQDAAGFHAMLTRQLRMTVSNRASMNDEILRNYLLPHQGLAGRASFFAHQVQHYDSRYTQAVAGDLRSLSMPVRIVWGADDRWQPVSLAERLHHDIPHSKLTVVPDAGHFLPEDAPFALTNEILDFLAQDGRRRRVWGGSMGRRTRPG